jgi:DNA-binding transcriptional LysR family regulator
VSKFQWIELFLAAVREGSFSAAGRRSGLSPGSVSRHIGALEGSVGVQLLHRNTRHLALTEAGSVYYQRVEAAMQSIRDAEAAAGAFQTKPRGILRVHSRVMFGVQIVAPLIPRFQDMYSDVKLELLLGERHVRLDEEACDIELRIGQAPDSALMQRRILSSERILVASPAYAAAMPPLAHPRDLSAHRCLVYWMGPEEVIWRFLCDGVLEEVHVPATVRTNSGQALRQLALLGHGIALLDDYSVATDLREGRLVRLLADTRSSNTAFSEGIYALFRPTQYLPAKIQAFLDFLAAAAPASLRA